MGLFGIQSTETGATTSGIWIKPNGGGWSNAPATDNDLENGILTVAGGASSSKIAGQRWCATDSSQQIQHFNESGDDSTAIDTEGFLLDIR